MKKIIWLLLVLCVGCSSKEASIKKGKTFRLSGKISPTPVETYIKLIASEKGKRVEWLTFQVSKDGTFSQEIALAKEGFYLLTVGNRWEELILFTGEDVELTIDLATKKVSYLRSLENQLNKRYDSLYTLFDAQREAILRKYQQNQGDKKLTEEYNAFIKATREQMKRFVEENRSPLVSLRILDELDMEEELAFFEKTLAEMAQKYPTNDDIKSLQEAVTKVKVTAIGQIAPDIALTNPDGKRVSLWSLRGKVVLIDFWASWCGPCRRENPNVVKLYEKYKHKGFEIYGVSLDRDRKAWIEAIKEDGLPWIHVSDLKFWQSEAAKLYNISAIPTTVLLDKEGKIIAKNLRGKALEEAIEKVL